MQGSTLTDINNAMWAGHEVTVHEKTLSYKGWTGEGYSIVDPNTGAGAYLINGGANGGYLIAVGVIMVGLAVALFVASIVTTPVTAGIGTLLGASLALNTLLSGFAFIFKGIEILIADSTDTSTACGFFSAFYASLISNAIGGVAAYIFDTAAGYIAGSSALSTLFGISTVTGINLCYTTEENQ